MKSSSRALIVLLAVVGIGALVWLAISSRTRSQGALGPEISRADAPTAPEVLDPRATPRDAKVDERAPITEATGRNDAASATSSATQAGWRILVVDALDRRPVEGANVRWMPGATFGALSDVRRPFERADAETLLAPDAPHATTDRDGMVELPEVALPGFVAANSNGRAASRLVSERREEPIVLTLRPELHVDVRVVDESGSPVSGVPVEIRIVDGTQNVSVWQGTTSSPDGVAHARHLEHHHLIVPRIAAGTPIESLYAGLAFPTRKPTFVIVDLARAALEPVTLVMPPCGSIELRLRDAQGAAIGALKATLSPQSVVDGRGALETKDATYDPVEIEEGRAWFPFVETGLEFAAVAWFVPQHARKVAPGPMRAGEVVTVDLESGSAKPKLIGRLLHADGSPASSLAFQYDLQLTSTLGGKGGSVSSSAPSYTDAQGRFRLDLPSDDPENVLGTLSCHVPGVPGREKARVVVRLDGRLHAGVNDLGDLVVNSGSVLVTGLVVDGSGSPVSSPMLGVAVRRIWQGRETWAPDDTVWIGSSTTDGHFEVRGEATSEPLRLTAKALDLVQIEPCTVSVGARDVRLTMARAGEISGSVLVDSPSQLANMSIATRVPGQPDANLGASPTFERVHVQPDGTFRLRELIPRVVDLVVTIPGHTQEPLLVIPNVDLRGGGPSQDPRITSIDVRGRIPEAPTLPASKR